MSRIPPFNLRLSSGTLKCQTAGTSVYFFRHQLKQQLSLQNAIDMTSQTLTWRVLQGEPFLFLNRTVMHGLLPMATRFRSKLQLENLFTQSQILYHRKWFCYAALTQHTQEKNDLKGPCENTMLDDGHWKVMLNYKNYHNYIKDQKFRLCELNPALPSAAKQKRVLSKKPSAAKQKRVLSKNALGSDVVSKHEMQNFKPNVLASNFWQKDFQTQVNIKNNLNQRQRHPWTFAYLTTQPWSSTIFSLFCAVLVSKNIIKPVHVPRYGKNQMQHGSNLKNQMQHGSNLKNHKAKLDTYDHCSKVGLSYQADGLRRNKYQKDKNHAVRFSLQAKGQHSIGISKYQFILGYTFGENPHLSLFNFESKRFSGAAKQKGSKRMHGFLTGCTNLTMPSTSRAWRVRKTSMACFRGQVNHNASTCHKPGLNTYINLSFHMLSENNAFSENRYSPEHHLTSDLSLRL